MTSNELKHKAKLQEWALTVQECRSSGKPVKQWCIENKINAQLALAICGEFLFPIFIEKKSAPRFYPQN